MDREQKGLLLVCLSALTFGTTPLLTMLVYRAGCNPPTLLLLRHLIGLPVFLLLAKTSVTEVWRGRGFRLTVLGLPRTHRRPAAVTQRAPRPGAVGVR